MNRYPCLLFTVFTLGLTPFAASGADFTDPLDVPAVTTPRASSSLMLDIAQAGPRLVAVGEFGRIIVSDDKGQTWRQVASPVSVDLTSVNFSSPSTGWVAGHGGVILQTIDNGSTWTKCLDGRDVEALVRRYYQQRLAAGDESAAAFLKDVDLNFQNGPELPFLGIWVSEQGQGFAVGAFGLILATVDGGKHWQPWMDRLDNPDLFHLNAVKQIADAVFIVGERGRVWKLDAEIQRFIPHPTGYDGSLFGITGDSAHLVAFGLRGNAFRSTDLGEHWEALPLPTQSSINAGAITADGRLALATQTGQLLLGAVNQSTFTVSHFNRPALLTSVVVDDDAIVAAGSNGVQKTALTRKPVATQPRFE